MKNKINPILLAVALFALNACGPEKNKKIIRRRLNQIPLRHLQILQSPWLSVHTATAQTISI